jgi:hypothetical protein
MLTIANLAIDRGETEVHISGECGLKIVRRSI